jgi:hypothetical protein
VTWGVLKALVLQAQNWSAINGQDVTQPKLLLVCLLVVLTIKSQGIRAQENHTHWSFVPYPPILRPKVWGELLPVFWNNASHTLGGGPLPDGYNISEQLQLSQYDCSFVGYPICFCPLRGVNMTCSIPFLQAQLNYRYTWDNSTGVGLLLSTVVPVNNCTDANCTRPPTPLPFLPHCPKVQTYAQGLGYDHVPWTTCIGLYPTPIHPRVPFMFWTFLPTWNEHNPSDLVYP